MRTLGTLKMYSLLSLSIHYCMFNLKQVNYSVFYQSEKKELYQKLETQRKTSMTASELVAVWT